MGGCAVGDVVVVEVVVVAAAINGWGRRAGRVFFWTKYLSIEGGRLRLLRSREGRLVAWEGEEGSADANEDMGSN